MYTRIIFIVTLLALSGDDAWARGEAFVAGAALKNVTDFTTTQVGKFGENFAAETYRLRGYTVVSNPNGHKGIDLIAYKGSLQNMTDLKIVEVKTTLTGQDAVLTKKTGQMGEKWITKRIEKLGKSPNTKFQMTAKAAKSFAAKNGARFQQMGEVFHTDVLNNKYTIYDDVTNLRNTKFSSQSIDRSLSRISERARSAPARTNAVRLGAEYDQLYAKAAEEAAKKAQVKGVPTPSPTNAAKATRVAKFGAVLRIAGGATGIVVGVVDIGGGVYELREIDRRFAAGELDYDIAIGKRIVVGNRMALGGVSIATGILLLVPDPTMITKAVALGLTITIVAGHAVLMVVDHFLERTQAKRMERRKELLASIDWEIRQSVCIEQLRKMAASPTLAL